MDKNIVNYIKNFSLSMYRKNFIGIFHGSISAKISKDRFIINKKEAVFDNITEESLIEIRDREDYRWKEASIDTKIHLNIYKNISEAKYICYAMPEFTTSYSIKNQLIIPKDYFGYIFLGEVPVYDIKDFSTWYQRADREIYNFFKEKNRNMMVIKGYGVYIYGRKLSDIAKKLAILENSCKILYRIENI